MTGTLRYLVLAVLLAFSVGQLRLSLRTGWCATFFYSLAILLFYPALAWGVWEPDPWIAAACSVGLAAGIVGVVITATFEQGAHRLLSVASPAQLLSGGVPKAQDIPSPPRWRFDTREALQAAGVYAFLGALLTVMWQRPWPALLFGPAAIGIILVIALRWLLGR